MNFKCRLLTSTNLRIMAPQLFAAICVIICVVALYFAYKIYKDTRKLKKKVEDDDETEVRF